jgi:proline iminopeptidase
MTGQLYPPIRPHRTGMLEVGQGNRVYWEECGNPAGKPALVLHGGPGQGCTERMRQVFDPRRYQIVLFDQRGCGRSTPHAADPGTDLAANTTEHLLADMELLREHLGVQRWLLRGGSWGCTLALAYAQRFPHRVSEIVLSAISLSRRAEIDWLYRGVARLFPGEWARFRDGVPEADREGDLVAAYARLLSDPDPAVREPAARSWRTWEDAVLSLEPNGKPADRPGRPTTGELAFTRICAHYYANAAWLPEDHLLREAPKLAGIPGVLIHGRLDLSCPLDTAWALARAWPDAELITQPDAGHRGGPARRAQVIAALDRFADR